MAAPCIYSHSTSRLQRPQIVLTHSFCSSYCLILLFSDPPPICCLFAQTNFCLFGFFPPFCYFISSPPEMNMAAERPPDDPQPIMYVESYPYPLSSNKQEITRAPLSKPSSLGGCMLLRGMCSCVIKSERSQTCQALHKLKLKSEDSPDSNFLLDLNSQRWRPVLVLHHCWVVDFTASSKYMWCKIVR